MNKFTDQQLEQLREAFGLFSHEPMFESLKQEMDDLLAGAPYQALRQLAGANIPHLSAAAETARQIRWSNSPLAENLTQTASRDHIGAQGDEGVLL